MEIPPTAGRRRLSALLTVPVRRWRVVAGVVLVCLLLGVFLLRAVPAERTATSVVSIAPLTGQSFPVTSRAAQFLDLPAEVEYVRSDTVLEQAADRIDGDVTAEEIARGLSVSSDVVGTVVRIAYADTDGDQAVAVANAVAAAYLSDREERATRRTSPAVEALQESITELEAELLAVNKKIAVGKQLEAVAGTPGPALLDARSEKRVLLSQLRDLNNRRAAAVGVVESPGVVTSSADADQLVSDASASFYLGTAAVLGLLLGLVLAFVRERTDKRVHGEAVIQQVTGVHVLADVGAAAHHSWLSRGEEQRLQLARSRLLATITQDTRVLLVLASMPDQSASGMARHLAESLTRGGQQVSLLLLGGMLSTPGESLSDTIEVDRLGIGMDSLELADLVQSPLVRDRIDTMRTSSRFSRGHAGNDIAIVAAEAPLDRASEIALSRTVDGVLLTIDPRGTDTDGLQSLVTDLRTSGAALVGAVISRSTRQLRRQATLAAAPPTRPSTTAVRDREMAGVGGGPGPFAWPTDRSPSDEPRRFLDDFVSTRRPEPPAPPAERPSLGAGSSGEERRPWTQRFAGLQPRATSGAAGGTAGRGSSRPSWLLVPAGALVGLLLGLVAMLGLDPTYTSEASVRVPPTGVESVIDPSASSVVSTPTEALVLTSDEVLATVAEETGRTVEQLRGAVSASDLANSTVLVVTATGGTGGEARSTVEAVVDAYVAQRHATAQQALDDFLTSARQRIREELAPEIARLREAVAEAPEGSARSTRLVARQTTVESELSSLSTQVATARTRTPIDPVLLQPASAPTEPDFPSPVFVLAVVTLAGTAAGVAAWRWSLLRHDAP